MVELGALLLGFESWRKWGLAALGFTVASFVPALLTGFINASRFPAGGAHGEIMALHRNVIIAVTVASVVALAIRLRAGERIEGASKWAYLALLAMASGLIGFAGHLGGKMVYGPNYLPF
jgi:hypothetical protein